MLRPSVGTMKRLIFTLNLQYQPDYGARIRETETPDERIERLGLIIERRSQQRMNRPTQIVNNEMQSID